MSVIERLEQYNITWHTSGRSSADSMPLGNGDSGVNIWVEQDGDLLFYISKTDAWSEHARLLKLGRIRVHLSPSPFAQGMAFEQTLHLSAGSVVIRAGTIPVTLLLWVDAHHPVIHVEVASEQAIDVQVTLETWRTAPRTIAGQEMHSAYGLYDAPYPIVESPDVVLPGQHGQITWFHRNEGSIWPDTLREQGLDGALPASADPLLHRMAGGVIQGETFVARNDHTLASQQADRSHHIAIYLLTMQAITIDAWLDRIKETIADSEARDRTDMRQAHLDWWRDFWERSWIFVSGDEDAEKVTCGYLLQRFINACGGRGQSPIKFNGSIFTVDTVEPGEAFDADYRRWGGPYWFQNTRLPYWSLLAAGDFDLLPPLSQMYQAALPLARERTRSYFGHEGAFFPETMYFWGTYTNDDFGWKRSGLPISYVANPYIRYYYQSGLELSDLLLDYYTYTHDQAFLEQTLLPLVNAVLQFYDQHYPRGEDGKLLLKPAQSLEMFEAINPLPDIAGLSTVLSRLLSLPEGRVLADQQADWRRLYQQLPPLPAGKVDGQTVLLPAEHVLEEARNTENPELYAIFPYRLYTIGRPELHVGRATFHARAFKGTGGWRQDAIQAAYLGLTEIARADVVQNFTTAHQHSSFPAFWGPNFDWVPDQDHGCVAMIALQKMVLQTVGSKILLLPAWPREWNVAFKLHAPHNTTIEGDYSAGRLAYLKVTPIEREGDVVLEGENFS